MLKSFQLASLFVEKSTLPVLEGVYIDFDNKFIKTTNMEGYFKMKLNDLEGKGEGKIVVDAKNLLNVMKSLKTFDIVKENNELKVFNEKTYFDFQGLDYSEYPATPEIEGEAIKIKAGDLAKGIKRVINNILDKNFFPVLTAMLLKYKDGQLYFVGTDSFRLAEYKIPVEGIDKEFAIHIPKKNLEKILKVISLMKDDDMIELILPKDENLLKIKGSIDGQDFEIITILIEGDYPKYEHIIPEDEKIKTRIEVDKKELEETVKNLLTFNKNIDAIKISIIDDEIILKTEKEDGEGSGKIKIKKEGEDVDLKFNGKYLLSLLKDIESDIVKIGIVNSTDPIKVLDLSDENYVYIARPMA